jgi:VWFA-related protein
MPGAAQDSLEEQARASRARCILALGFALFAGTSVGAQAPPEAPPETAGEETFFEAIQVGVAEVEVIVTDSEGRRVTDLQREDFTLYEDGELVEVTHFAAAAAASDAGSAPPDRESPRPGLATTQPPRGLLLALFVDNQSLAASGRHRLIRAVREFLAEGLQPGDRIMLAVQDTPGSLRVAVPPTTDLATVVTALDEIEKSAPGGTLTANAVARLLRDIESAAPPGGNDSVDDAADVYAAGDARRVYEDILEHGEEVRHQVLAAAAALGELVDALAALPGRKAVVMLSGGMSTRPVEALLKAWNNRYGEMGREWGISSRLDELERGPGRFLDQIAEHANGNQVTLYAMGATEVPDMANASLRSNDYWGMSEEQTERANVQQSLHTLVGPTGGTASLDAGNPGLLMAEVREDLQTYYSLGYTPTRRKPGMRDLRVEVSRPGLRVRHREERRDRSSREIMVERTQAGLLLGWEDNPLGVEVETGVASKGERRGQELLPVTVKVPMANLVLLPAGAFHDGRLTVFLASIDDSGRSSEVTEVAVPIRVPNEQLLEVLGQSAAYRTQLVVHSDRRQRIVVSVRDELGNAMATVSVRPFSELAAEAESEGGGR